MKKSKLRTLVIMIMVLFTGTSLVSADFSVTKTATNTTKEDEYKINFSIPADVIVPKDIDVVFVMDQTTNNAVFNGAKSLLNNLKDLKNIKVNVAVVKFAHNATNVTSGFIPLSDSTLSTLNSALTRNSGVGSNVYGGTLMAKNLLSTRTSDKENQYIILASDFANNRFDSGDGIGISQFYSDNSGIANVTCAYGCYPQHLVNGDFDAKYRTLYVNGLTTTPFHTFEKLDSLIQNNVTFNGNPLNSSTLPFFLNIGPQAGMYSVPVVFFGDPARRVLSPEELLTTMPVSLRTGPNTATQLEKFYYHNFNMLSELNNSGVNITTLTSPYSAGTGNWAENIATSVNLYQDYLVHKGIVKEYDTSVSSNITDFTNEMYDVIKYSMYQGKLTDVIAPEFDYVTGSEIVSYNGTILEKNVISTNSFGYWLNPLTTSLPYDVVYTYSNENGTEQIVVDVVKPLGDDDILNVSFNEKLVVLPTVIGTSVIDTNQSAKLEYVDSNDFHNGTTTLNQVKNIPTPTIDVTMGEVILKYVDEKGNSLLTQESYLFREGFSYSYANKAISNYTYKGLESSSAPLKGTINNATQTITMVYVKDPIIEQQVKLSFETNGGNKIAHQVLDSGDLGTKPQNPTKMGYTFEGWFTNQNLTNPFNFDTPIIIDTVIYAKWSVTPDVIENVLLSFESNGGSLVDSQTIVKGKVGTIPSVPTKNGYTFAGWYVNSKLNELFDFSLGINVNTIVYAKWIENPKDDNKVNLTFVTNGGTSIPVQTIEKGSLGIKPTDPTRKGYVFVGWFTDQSFKDSFDFYSRINTSTTVYAKWKLENDDEKESLPETGLNSSIDHFAGAAILVGAILIVIRRLETKRKKS